ncbi:UDP-glucose/GDP-mannose dehydrogenase family protein [Allopusillimonas soli]|uniref:UDP-glucose 6-dehydrogenase n=1 Tax=Allopusillimonas soli TaxID=659016 RepID=A0A853FHV5_9BURK|nr:UDP-glucose/GDP-mannose dehydrogenase family protein [Allopusillimonas soli]NYT38021.1 UDP-glucose/GDP-mannose dehydrogenase family protein [Allopusillimonas soli]TEA74085.1 UDP-glucose/GDP-mannose dehydrogenase family protein [Allopusillimonas soli]
MNITLIGSGYVGLVTGTCFAELGNQVVCLDVDKRKIDLLNSGGVPIYEPGLQELIARNAAAGRLRFTTDVQDAVAHGDVLFIAVGTPPDEDGSADLKHVLAVARDIGRWMQGFKIVVNKSTVPVGTADKVAQAISAELEARGHSPNQAGPQDGNIPSFAVVSNPEFLKEGAAVEDFMRPDRIVIGVPGSEAGNRAREAMRVLYAPFNRNHDRTYFMDVRSAEFTKYAANSMLASRISFMNELANLAEQVGADIEMVRHGIGSDPRIGFNFLYAGVGFGGSCFPKDIQALIKIGQEHNSRLRILEAVNEVNDRQKLVLTDKIIRRFGDSLKGRHFALWGLAFKPNTDDMREAPSRAIIKALVERGATICAYDPIATEVAKQCLAQDFAAAPELLKAITYSDSHFEALNSADALVIVTDWKSFKSPDFSEVKARLSEPLLFDGRNLYEPEAMAELGIEYYGIGRSNGHQESLT